MVSEGWSVQDAIDFANKQKIDLVVLDKNGTTIPKEEYDSYTNKTITKQSLPEGYSILEGRTFKITVDEIYEVEVPEEEPIIEDTEEEN